MTHGNQFWRSEQIILEPNRQSNIILKIARFEFVPVLNCLRQYRIMRKWTFWRVILIIFHGRDIFLHSKGHLCGVTLDYIGKAQKSSTDRNYDILAIVGDFQGVVREYTMTLEGYYFAGGLSNGK